MTANTRDILAGYGLAPSKKRGQNFLKHRSTALRIVAKAEFTKEDHIMGAVHEAFHRQGNVWEQSTWALYH